MLTRMMMGIIINSFLIVYSTMHGTPSAETKRCRARTGLCTFRSGQELIRGIAGYSFQVSWKSNQPMDVTFTSCMSEAKEP